MAHAHNADRQMSCQVDAPKKKDRPEDKIRGDGKNTQQDVIDGDSSNRTQHQGNHGGKRQCGGAKHCCRGGKNSHAHAGTPTTNVIWNAATVGVKLRTNI
jgi:hypothetical protein